MPLLRVHRGSICQIGSRGARLRRRIVRHRRQRVGRLRRAAASQVRTATARTHAALTLSPPVLRPLSTAVCASFFSISVVVHTVLGGCCHHRYDVVKASQLTAPPGANYFVTLVFMPGSRFVAEEDSIQSKEPRRRQAAGGAVEATASRAIDLLLRGRSGGGGVTSALLAELSRAQASKSVLRSQLAASKTVAIRRGVGFAGVDQKGLVIGAPTSGSMAAAAPASGSASSETSDMEPKSLAVTAFGISREAGLTGWQAALLASTNKGRQCAAELAAAASGDASDASGAGVTSGHHAPRKPISNDARFAGEIRGSFGEVRASSRASSTRRSAGIGGGDGSGGGGWGGGWGGSSGLPLLGGLFGGPSPSTGGATTTTAHMSRLSQARYSQAGVSRVRGLNNYPATGGSGRCSRASAMGGGRQSTGRQSMGGTGRQSTAGRPMRISVSDEGTPLELRQSIAMPTLSIIAAQSRTNLHTVGGGARAAAAPKGRAGQPMRKKSTLATIHEA